MFGIGNGHKQDDQPKGYRGSHVCGPVLYIGRQVDPAGMEQDEG